MYSKRKNQIGKYAIQLVAILLGIYILHSCANIGNPEGGPYDMTPPRLVKASPKQGALEVSGKRISLYFDEFIKLSNQNEQVIISPPQLKSPRITAVGKEIDIRLEDSLKPNTTYSIYFGDAIVDNNEDNPLEDFGYTFSTGSTIDSMRIGGIVLDAETLEPVPSLIVGAYPSASTGDSTFFKQSIPYASRTNKVGKFSIRGLKPSTYSLMALQDNDNNLLYSAGEGLAFEPKSYQTTLLDSIKTDTIRIDSIVRRDTLYRDSLVTYPHTYYYPDNVVLRFFASKDKKLGLDRSSRTDSLQIDLEFFSRPDTIPELHFLGQTAKSPQSLYYPTRNGDNIIYWLKDPTLISADSIQFTLSYIQTDSTGIEKEKLDTLTFYKPKARKTETKKDDSIPKLCELAFRQSSGILSGTLADSLILSSKQPIEHMPSEAIRLEIKVDSTTSPVPFTLEPLPSDGLSYLVRFDREYGASYIASIDSAALRSIYGLPTTPTRIEQKIMKEEELGGIRLSITDIEGDVFVQLLDKSDNVLQTKKALSSVSDAKDQSTSSEEQAGETTVSEELDESKKSITPIYTVTFEDLKPEEYYARLYIDANGDGVWTTGSYPTLQPETVYYYPQVLSVKKSFTTDEPWQPLSTPLEHQKPLAIRKVKPEEKKKREDKNIEYFRKQENMRRKK